MVLGAEGSRSRSAADRRLGRYELVVEAGETAIGTVFVGRVALGADRGRPVLVRRVEKGADHDDGTLQALREAANEVLAVRHPRVLPGLEARLGTSLVIATGYAEGELLRQLIEAARARAAAISSAFATRLIADLVTTLASVRDVLAEAGLDRPLAGLCPDCVLVDPQARCHLADLGIATLQRPPRQAELMAYRAPEQLGPPGDADERSVVFSAAVIWWELLANQSLFGGGDQAAVWQRVRRAAIVPPAAASPAARDVLMRALARDPTQRFATLDDFAAALSGLEVDSSATGVEAARTVDELAGAALRARRAAFEGEPVRAHAQDAPQRPQPPPGVADVPPAAELPRPASFLSLRPTEGVPDEGDWEVSGIGAPSPGPPRDGLVLPSPPRQAPVAASPMGVAPTAPPVAPLPTIEPPATVREGKDRPRRPVRGEAPAGAPSSRRRAAPAPGRATPPASALPAATQREARRPAAPAGAAPVSPQTGAVERAGSTPPRPRGSVSPPRPGRRAAEEPVGAALAPAAGDESRTELDVAPDSQRDTVEVGLVTTLAGGSTPSAAPVAERAVGGAAASTEPPLASESLAGPVQRSGSSSRPPEPERPDAAATHAESAVGLERLAASVHAEAEALVAGAVAGVSAAAAAPALEPVRRRSLLPLVLVAGGLSFAVAFAVVALLLARGRAVHVAAAPPEAVSAAAVSAAAVEAAAPLASESAAPAPSIEAPTPSEPGVPPEPPVPSVDVPEPVEPPVPPPAAPPRARRGGATARTSAAEAAPPEPERPAEGDGAAEPPPAVTVEAPPAPPVAAVPDPGAPSPYD